MKLSRKMLSIKINQIIDLLDRGEVRIALRLAKGYLYGYLYRYVRAIMCARGLHDLEVEECYTSRSALLACMYCSYKKSSVLNSPLQRSMENDEVESGTLN